MLARALLRCDDGGATDPARDRWNGIIGNEGDVGVAKEVLLRRLDADDMMRDGPVLLRLRVCLA